MTKFISIVLFTLSMTVAANAQMYVVGQAPEAVAGFNEFVASGDIPMGPNVFYGAPTIGFTQAGTVTFELVGHESGYHNSFYVGDKSDVNWKETSGGTVNLFDPLDTIGLGSVAVTAGSLADDWWFDNNQGGGAHVLANQTMAEYGVFFDPTAAVLLSGDYFTDSLILAFDDNGAGPDDNHDDMLVRATFVAAVPEPATWLMMIIGFGIIASSARRSRRRANSLA